MNKKCDPFYFFDKSKAGGSTGGVLITYLPQPHAIPDPRSHPPRPKLDQQFKTIFMESPTATALLRGPHFIFELFNSKFTEILPFHELTERALAEALPELADQLLQEKIKSVFESGQSQSITEILVRFCRSKEGEFENVYFDINCSRVVGDQGDPYGVCIYVFDVTERILARTRIQKLSTDLRIAVESKDEFLTVASHEIKTPLTSLKLQAQMLQWQIKRGDESVYSKPRIDGVAKHLERQINRLTFLVDDMFDVAQIRSGELKILRRSFDLCELIKDTIQQMHSQFMAAGCGLPTFAFCTSAMGQWDRRRIEQVLGHLFLNAIRYGNSKPFLIKIERSFNSTKLIVSDQGIGISKDVQTRIFDRFARAVDKNEVSGLGLGLFIANQIVKAHGGTLTVESKGKGLGASFILELPNDLKGQVQSFTHPLTDPLHNPIQSHCVCLPEE